jgi:hypothetical protein
MSSSAINIDPRIIPLVRSLKEQGEKSNGLLTKKSRPDLSSEKTSENSTKIRKLSEKKIKNQNENEKNKNDEKEKPKRQKNIKRYKSKTNTMGKKASNTKISIDGSRESKIKSSTSDNQQRNSQINNNNKIKIISKTREQRQSINLNNPDSLLLSSGQFKSQKLNNIKTKSKFVQNLLNDMSLKKYKSSCIDLLKNDNAVKKLYEQCGFEKTNYSYESFIQINFFNKPLFMYKLEMLFLEESNFIKKNFKENFFKSEIVKYLNEFTNEEIYKRQMTSLKDVFNDGFEAVINFDLFHD